MVAAVIAVSAAPAVAVVVIGGCWLVVFSDLVFVVIGVVVGLVLVH